MAYMSEEEQLAVALSEILQAGNHEKLAQQNHQEPIEIPQTLDEVISTNGFINGFNNRLEERSSQIVKAAEALTLFVTDHMTKEAEDVINPVDLEQITGQFTSAREKLQGFAEKLRAAGVSNDPGVGDKLVDVIGDNKFKAGAVAGAGGAYLAGKAMRNRDRNILNKYESMSKSAENFVSLPEVIQENASLFNNPTPHGPLRPDEPGTLEEIKRKIKQLYSDAAKYQGENPAAAAGIVGGVGALGGAAAGYGLGKPKSMTKKANAHAELAAKMMLDNASHLVAHTPAPTPQFTPEWGPHLREYYFGPTDPGYGAGPTSDPSKMERIKSLLSNAYAGAAKYQGENPAAAAGIVGGVGALGGAAAGYRASKLHKKKS